MFKTLLNIFRIPELRIKILFTLGLLCVYRIGFYVPLPGVDAHALAEQASSSSGGVLVALSNYMSVFSGGALGQSTIFGLGIMPYISASIILQLLGSVIPAIEKLRKEGEPGMRKINEWTRYLTVAVCLIQAFMWVSHLINPGSGQKALLYQTVRNNDLIPLFIIMSLVVLTTGSVFLMWLGEQIDQYGIGNGVSLIITAGIISRMPNAIMDLLGKSTFGNFFENMNKLGFSKAIALAFDPTTKADYKPYTIIFVIVAFVFVVAGSILMTQAQRRIKIQQAKHLRGRKVYGGQQAYLPLRVNHAGVMPIIFASTLMVFPNIVTQYLVNWTTPDTTPRAIAFFFAKHLNNGGFLFELLYIGMIFFFAYFWNTVQFNPKEIANQLRDYGTFIPGLRPGKRTAEYLENVMTRITYVGAAFLAVIAVVPNIVSTNMNIDQRISQFLGGTGLLIVISVMLDLINRIEANLVMRNYGGFLENNQAGNRLRDRIRGQGSSGRSSPSN